MFSRRRPLLLLALPVVLVAGLYVLASKRPEPLPLDHSPMAPIAISSDGRFVATNKGGQVDIIAVYDRARHRTTSFRTSDVPGAWVFLNDNHTLVTAGGERISSSGSGSCPIRLWDVTTQTDGLDQARPLRSFGPQTSSGNGLALSPDGTTLATGSTSGAILLWNVATGRVGATLRGAGHAPNALSFSGDGKRLLASYMSFQTNAALYDVTNNKQLWTARVAPQGGSFDVTSSSISPDGQVIALGSQNGKIALLDGRNGAVLRMGTMPTGNPNLMPSYPLDATRSVAFSPDGKTIASGAWSGAALWNVADASMRRSLDGSGPVAFSRDGHLLATGGASNARNGVILWKSF